MAVPDAEDTDTRYVTSYAQQGLEGYLVRVCMYPTGILKDKRWHTKLFAFKKFTTKREALLAAVAYRDSWFIAHETDRRLRPVGARFGIKLPANNSSGIVGVGRTERIGKSGTKEIQWQTTFPGTSTSHINKKFSVAKFGEIGALRRAVEARRDGMLDFLTTIPDDHVDTNLEVVSFYDDVLQNLKDYADFDENSPLLEIVRNPEMPATTKLDQILVRVGQQRFRREVLTNFDDRCAVTNSSLLIRASHIKPWRVCSDEERLDSNNGLALSPVYDSAFDLGLISFSADGRIIVSSKLRQDAMALGISGSERLTVLLEGHAEYLHWHRTHLYMS